MNNGITFEEACRQTSQGLTSEQLQNCPGEGSAAPAYLYVGIIGIALAAAVLLLVVGVKLKRKK